MPTPSQTFLEGVFRVSQRFETPSYKYYLFMIYHSYIPKMCRKQFENRFTNTNLMSKNVNQSNYLPGVQSLRYLFSILQKYPFKSDTGWLGLCSMCDHCIQGIYIRFISLGLILARTCTNDLIGLFPERIFAKIYPDPGDAYNCLIRHRLVRNTRKGIFKQGNERSIET